MNLPELDELESDSLRDDQGFRDKLSNETDDDFDVGRSSSESCDSELD